MQDKDNSSKSTRLPNQAEHDRMGFKPEVVAQLDEFIMRWDVKHPVDLWWRKHFNVPFGSLEHQNIDFLSQMFAYREHHLIDKAKDGELEETGVIKQINEPESGKKVIEMSQEEIEAAFDALDLSQFQ